MVKSMKPGSVIVDLAIEGGGNCTLSEFNKVVTKHGVKIVGHANVPGRLAADASRLFARNLLNFVTPMIDEETKNLTVDKNDEVVVGTLVTEGGKVVHEMLSAKPAKKAEDSAPDAEASEEPAGDAAAEAQGS